MRRRLFQRCATAVRRDLSILCLCVCVIFSSSKYQTSKRLRKPSLAVCITGQLARTEIDSKITSVFEPVHHAGNFIRAFVVLEHRVVPVYTSDFHFEPIVGQVTSKTLTSTIKRSLQPWLGSFVLREHQPGKFQPVDLKRLPQYRSEKNESRRKVLVEAHVSQFSLLRKCAQQIAAYELKAKVKTPVISWAPKASKMA